MLKKVVIIGPESTGKSTLCKQLARHYSTLWCPEYAREYLLKNGKAYTYPTLATIAKGQLQAEDEHVKQVYYIKENLLFIDTDMYVMKVWCEFVFGQCHDFILKEIAKRKYHLYLLCYTDLPWENDVLRECPDLQTREQLYLMYKDHLAQQNTPWVEIKGTCQNRLQVAIHAVEKQFDTNFH